MNAIMALFAIVSKTVATQEAIILVLEKKGIASLDDINAEILRTTEHTKALVDKLLAEFMNYLGKFEEGGAWPQQ
jgi:hypothetical protein